MARLDELAEGISKLMSVSAEPEPLVIDLLNHSPVEALVFVRAVIDACHRIGRPIAQVKICENLGGELLKQHGLDQGGYEGTQISSADNLDQQIAFYRYPV